jgi:hypothetical protein
MIYLNRILKNQIVRPQLLKIMKSYYENTLFNQTLSLINNA